MFALARALIWLCAQWPVMSLKALGGEVKSTVNETAKDEDKGQRTVTVSIDADEGSRYRQRSSGY